MSSTCLFYSKMMIVSQLPISKADVKSSSHQMWSWLLYMMWRSLTAVAFSFVYVESFSDECGRKLSACLLSGWEQCFVCQDRCSMLVSEGIWKDMKSFHLWYFPVFVWLGLVLSLHCAELDKVYLERVVSHATVTWQKLLKTSILF